jgi:hypothetical protein
VSTLRRPRAPRLLVRQRAELGGDSPAARDGGMPVPAVASRLGAAASFRCCCTDSPSDTNGLDAACHERVGGLGQWPPAQHVAVAVDVQHERQVRVRGPARQQRDGDVLERRQCSGKELPPRGLMQAEEPAIAAYIVRWRPGLVCLGAGAGLIRGGRPDPGLRPSSHPVGEAGRIEVGRLARGGPYEPAVPDEDVLSGSRGDMGGRFACHGRGLALTTTPLCLTQQGGRHRLGSSRQLRSQQARIRRRVPRVLCHQQWPSAEAGESLHNAQTRLVPPLTPEGRA